MIVRRCFCSVRFGSTTWLRLHHCDITPLDIKSIGRASRNSIERRQEDELGFLLPFHQRASMLCSHICLPLLARNRLPTHFSTWQTSARSGRCRGTALTNMTDARQLVAVAGRRRSAGRTASVPTMLVDFECQFRRSGSFRTNHIAAPSRAHRPGCGSRHEMIRG